jgi:hypothetical protein
MDFWERPVADLGLTGEDQGNGGKYLVIAPHDDPSQYSQGDRIVIQSATNNVFIGLRLLNPTGRPRRSSKRHAYLSTTGTYLEGISSEEIIGAMHGRKAPMMHASTGLEL